MTVVKRSRHSCLLSARASRIRETTTAVREHRWPVSSAVSWISLFSRSVKGAGSRTFVRRRNMSPGFPGGGAGPAAGEKLDKATMTCGSSGMCRIAAAMIARVPAVAPGEVPIR